MNNLFNNLKFHNKSGLIMRMQAILFGLLIIGLLSVNAQTMSNREEAMNIARTAVKSIDAGEYEKAIQLLEEAKDIDSTNYIYDYEIAYAHLLQKKYDASIKVLEEAISKYDTINAELFQLLGNVYDMNGNPEKALEVYDKGLEQFPNSGRLYYERGVVYGISLEDVDKALESWETGIEKEPTYPSNYFYTAKVYCDSEEELWGIMYGEIFMNLEKNSRRTAEMSEILFNTYQKALQIKSKKEVVVSFTQSSNMINLGSDGEFKMPFGMQYELTMSISATVAILGQRKKIKELKIDHLDKIRSQFTKTWFDNGNGESYPNVLFDWHQSLIKAGHFETYNQWLFMKGNEDESDEWFTSHEKEFEEFTEWFLANPIPLNEENCFVRKKY